MKPYTLFLLSLFLACRIYAQAPIAFERYYDFGWGNSEEGFCVQQTFDGGYIVAGRQIQGIGFSKMLLHKVDSLGNTQWTRFIGSAYDNEAYSVKQTADSGYILTGFTTDVNYTNFLTLVKTDASGNVMWSKNNISPIAALPQGGPGGGRGTDVLQTSDGGYAVIANITDWDTTSVSIFIRTDMNGDTLWSKKYRRFAGIGINSLRQTLDSNFILTGRVTLTITPTLTFGIYLIKANSIGDTLWTKIYTDPSTNNIGANTVVQTSDSGFFLSGYVYYSSSFSTDFFVLKTDQMGDTVWTRKIGGAGNEGGGGLQTNDGGYIISGITTSYGAGGSDVYLIKTNNVGQVQWTKTFGGQNNDFGDFIYQTSDGGFIISGTTESFGDGGSEYLIKTDSLGNAPTSISTLNPNENSVSVFPNPFSVSATVQISNDIFNHRNHFILYDVAGNEVMNFFPDATEFTIQRNDLSAGIYFYSLIGNENETLARGKIIIQ